MKMIDQEVDGLGFENDENDVSVDVEGLEGELEGDIPDAEEVFRQRANKGGHRHKGSNGEQHESTIINSSQNTSLEQNFMN